MFYSDERQVSFTVNEFCREIEILQKVWNKYVVFKFTTKSNVQDNLTINLSVYSIKCRI